MAIPSYFDLMIPILKVLDEQRTCERKKLIIELIHRLNLNNNEVCLYMNNGKQTIFSNRLGWALTYLGKAKLVGRVDRAVYRITARGKQILRDYPERLDAEILRREPSYQAFVNYRNNQRKLKKETV